MTIIKKLRSQWIDSENFASYGQLITPVKSNKLFDHQDAQLQLDQGIPRLYIMHLFQRKGKFKQITRHQNCTQCLGSLGGKEWQIAVCPPTSLPYPDAAKMRAFRIQGDCFIKFEVGTWHAGPYFEDEFVDFYNLELSDTNLVDYDTYDFQTQDDIEWEII